MLTTTEVAQLLDSYGARLEELPETATCPLLPPLQDRGSAAAECKTAAGTTNSSCRSESEDVLYGYPGGAGGYLEHVFRYISAPKANRL